MTFIIFAFSSAGRSWTTSDVFICSRSTRSTEQCIHWECSCSDKHAIMYCILNWLLNWEIDWSRWWERDWMNWWRIYWVIDRLKKSTKKYAQWNTCKASLKALEGLTILDINFIKIYISCYLLKVMPSDFFFLSLSWRLYQIYTVFVRRSITRRGARQGQCIKSRFRNKTRQ